MPLPEANDALRTTDFEASPRPASPDDAADAATGALPGDGTAVYVPGQATEPAATGPERARGLISVPGYEVEAVLGRGGMGVVYKARHLALKRTVALKMVLAGGHASPSELARFRIEAEAVARLQHPNIVHIHEVGEAEGHPYCALEFVEGGNLASRIDGKPLPAPESARLVEALARAMQLAHSRNVVHRDLKPANILLSPVPNGGEGSGVRGIGTPKITDFGLARQLDSDSGETQSGAVVGTPSYMAPEQASGRAHEAGPAADVYALGAILYNCLAGCPPFKGNSVVETLDQVRSKEPAPPSRAARSGDRATTAGGRATTVPPDLETICLKCLRKEPEKRYASAAELADDLVRYQRGEAIQARPVGQLERALKWAKRNPLLGLALATLLLVTALGVAGVVWKYLDAGHQKGIAEEKRQDAEKQTAIAKKNEDDAKRQLSNSTFLLAVSAYDNRDVPLARQRLASIEADYRGWEWFYFRRQSSGGIFTLYGHTDAVQSVAFSPDGARIVTGSNDKTVKVWDARTGAPLMALQGFQESVPCVAFSPDGTRIVTGGGDKTAKVWDARTGAPLLELKGHTNGVSGVAYSPDGTRIVTGGWDKTAKVWDARTATLLLELKGHKEGVRCVAFSPDGARIATGGWDKTARLWDAWNGTPLGELKVGNGNVLCLAFSPDGTRIVTGSSDQTAKVADARTGAPLFELKGHTGAVWSVAYSPDGTRIVTGGGDQTAKVWDARTRTPLLEMKGHTDGVSGVAFSPDGTLIVTASADKTAKLWDARVATPQLELKGHTGGVWSAAFNRDGRRVVTGSWDKTARVWDANTGAPQLELKGHTSFVWSAAFSPDGTRVATGSLDNTAKIWDANTGTPLVELKGHAAGVKGVAFSPDGTRVATGSQDKTAKVWDAETGKPLLKLDGHKGELHSVAFSPDGARIVTASEDMTAKVWDAETGTPLLELAGHTGAVYSAAFSPDGARIVTASEDKTAKVWDAQTGTPLLELKGHLGPVYSAAFSPDGARIVTGSPDKTAKVWDAQTGTPLLELKGHTDTVISVAFSRDGARIVTGSWDQTAKVWDAPRGAPLLELKGRTGEALSAAFTEDGTRIVTRSRGQTARLWAARTGRELKGEPVPQTKANSETSPDGHYFAYVEGNRVEVLPLIPDSEELAYRRWSTQPRLERYREDYEAALAAQDDFAARFYLNLLPPAEQQMLTLEGAAERDIAAGRTQDALAPLVALSAANPEDTILSLKVAALQAWFGEEKEYADTCVRALEFAKRASVPATAERAAKICCLLPTHDSGRRESALALARQAVQLGQTDQLLPWFQMTLGMAEYRRGNDSAAAQALLAAAEAGKGNPYLAELAAFYRAMNLFRQGKADEARKLAVAAAANMKPLPQDEKNPLAGDADHDDLILWLAYKEAKGLIHFDAAPPPSQGK